MQEGDTPKEVARLRALVHGRVQGVYFRDFARSHARQLGLVGWVRNLADGATVEVMAQGPSPAVNRMLEYLRQGPTEAHVAQVDVTWEPAIEETRSFEVRW